MGFLEDDSKTGLVAECSINNIYYRKQLEWGDEMSEALMARPFENIGCRNRRRMLKLGQLPPMAVHVGKLQTLMPRHSTLRCCYQGPGNNNTFFCRKDHTLLLFVVTILKIRGLTTIPHLALLLLSVGLLETHCKCRDSVLSTLVMFNITPSLFFPYLLFLSFPVVL